MIAIFAILTSLRVLKKVTGNFQDDFVNLLKKITDNPFHFENVVRVLWERANELVGSDDETDNISLASSKCSVGEEFEETKRKQSRYGLLMLNFIL